MPKRKVQPKSRKQAKLVPKPRKTKEDISDLLDSKPTEKPSAFYYHSRDGSQLVLVFREDAVVHAFTWEKAAVVLTTISLDEFRRCAHPTTPFYPKDKWLGRLNDGLKTGNMLFTKRAKDALLNINEGRDPYAFRELSLEEMLDTSGGPRIKRGPALPKEERRRLRRVRRQNKLAAMTPKQLEERKVLRRNKRKARLAAMTPEQLKEKKQKREARRLRRLARRKEEAAGATVSKRR